MTGMVLFIVMATLMPMLEMNNLMSRKVVTRGENDIVWSNYEKMRKQTGFTLLEVMVVVVILGILASFVGPNLLGNKEKADQQKAVTDIVALENALDMYKLDGSVYRRPIKVWKP